ncbi:MAG: type II toxin-antitoxin system VapC family toxin [Sulfuricella sp.]|nr:type II toxin-antitoxin system VapC family toxin [Sulfuricella sp.]
MIVADVNLVAQLILKLDRTETAQAVFRSAPEWVMPELWRHEFLNVLANYLRFDRVPAERLALAWQSANALFAESIRQPDMLLALKLAGERGASAYDAQYLALAQTLGLPLVTEDRKLRQAAPDLTLSMQEFIERNPQ